MTLNYETLRPLIHVSESGRLIDTITRADVWRTKEVPAMLAGMDILDLGWMCVTHNKPKGKVMLMNDDVVGPFTLTNMIDSGDWTYANGAPVDEITIEYLKDKYEIEDQTTYIFEDGNSNRPKENQRLPVGVTQLKNGKYRFKRKTGNHKVDFVSESYEEVLAASKDYEDELKIISDKMKYRKIEEDSMKVSGIDMTNIYKRGRQYYVEFMIRRSRYQVIKTYDLDEAVQARDEFLKHRKSAKATLLQQEKLHELKIYEDMLEEGLTELDYGSIKMAINYMNKEQFDSVVENYTPPVKVNI